MGFWGFGWNKYGQLGVGDTRARDSVTRMMALPKGRHVATLRWFMLNKRVCPDTELLIDILRFQVWWLGDSCSDKQREMRSNWLLMFTNISMISTPWSRLFMRSFSRHCTEFKFLIQVPLCSFESVPRLIPWKTKSICVVFSQILHNLRARCWSIFKNYSTGFLITSILHDM